jgi:hypothetical protein
MPVQTLIVDGANVVGSTPDGWWRDRAGAARRLRGRLAAAHLDYDDVVLVLEGEATAGVPPERDGRLRVVHARGSGDDAIVAEASRQRAMGSGGEVDVVTADRGLRERLTAIGVQTRGPRWLLGRI